VSRPEYLPLERHLRKLADSVGKFCCWTPPLVVLKEWSQGCWTSLWHGELLSLPWKKNLAPESPGADSTWPASWSQRKVRMRNERVSVGSDLFARYGLIKSKGMTIYRCICRMTSTSTCLCIWLYIYITFVHRCETPTVTFPTVNDSGVARGHQRSDDIKSVSLCIVSGVHIPVPICEITIVLDFLLIIHICL
jgi:hypothetical protein